MMEGYHVYMMHTHNIEHTLAQVHETSLHPPAWTLMESHHMMELHHMMTFHHIMNM